VETAKTIAVALLVALALRVLLFQPYTIPSASMEPNLFEGDYIIVSKFDYGYSRASLPITNLPFHGRLLDKAPARGDVVVFLLPRDERQTYIKRLIGLPGDRVQVRGHGRRRDSTRPALHRDSAEWPPLPDQQLWARRGRGQHGGLCGAAALLFHDGGQSRQLPGQPL
jgi:signal peptidase I